MDRRRFQRVSRCLAAPSPSCSRALPPPRRPTTLDVIPRPLSVVGAAGAGVRIDAATPITTDPGDAGAGRVAGLLRVLLGTRAGRSAPLAGTGRHCPHPGVRRRRRRSVSPGDRRPPRDGHRGDRRRAAVRRGDAVAADDRRIAAADRAGRPRRDDDRRRAALSVARAAARQRPARPVAGVHPAHARLDGAPQAQHAAVASDRRSGLAARDQALPAADRGRRLPHDTRRADALRRLLHAGRGPRARRLCRRAQHHDRPRDRAARPCARCDPRLSRCRTSPGSTPRRRATGASSRRSTRPTTRPSPS